MIGGDSIKPSEVESADNIDMKKMGGNMLVVNITWGDQTETIFMKASPEKRLLFDTKIEGRSLYSVLFKDLDKSVEISENPVLHLKPGPFDNMYRIYYRDHYPVLTNPEYSSALLNAIVDIVQENDWTDFVDLFETFKEQKVNRDFVSRLCKTSNTVDFDRIEVNENGFVIDGLLLLTWDAEIHTNTERWDDGAFTPHGEPKNKPSELREIEVPDKEMTVEIDGYERTIDGIEWEFIYKLKYLLDWRDNIEDGTVPVLERTVPIIKKLEEQGKL